MPGPNDQDFAERSEFEPDEFDPDSLGPDVPSAPAAPDMAANQGNADPAVARAFWTLAVVFNVAIMALSVGAMFVIFRGNYSLGGQLVAVGTILAAYGFYRYRNRPTS